MGEPLEHEVLVTVASSFEPLPYIMRFLMADGTTHDVPARDPFIDGFPIPSGAVRILRIDAPPGFAGGSTISIGVAPGKPPAAKQE